MLKLKITFILLLTLFCCLFIGCSENDIDEDLVEPVPTVNLIDGGIRKGTERWPIAYYYTLGIDKPLDHDLVIAIGTEGYNFDLTDPKDIDSESLCIIKKGNISTGEYLNRTNIPLTRVVITVLPPQRRLHQNEEGLTVPIQDSAFTGFDDDEKIDPEDVIIDIPVDYDFKPYNIGIHRVTIFNFDN